MLDDVCASLVWMRQAVLLGRCAFKSKRVQFQYYQIGCTFMGSVLSFHKRGENIHGNNFFLCLEEC